MEFGNFKPNFVPRPVDQISNMLGKLDENNRRVSTAYHNVAQAFDSFNVAPVDKDYVDNMRNNIMSTMDEVIQSGDYAKMEGQLNKSVRQISSDPGLKARILRYQDYNNKRNMVSDMYYKGTGDNKIDKLTYDIAMAQEYMPTQPDEHGVYDNEYKEFELPPKYFDVQTYLMNVAKQVEANSTTDTPTIKYMTNKEYLTSMGADISGMSEAELNKPTSYLGYIKLGDKEYKTPQKITEALTSMISANPDAQAYLNYISKHTGKPVASIIAENVNPIANMTSYVKDDSRYQMFGEGLSKSRNKKEEKVGTDTNISTGIQLDKQSDIVDKITPSWTRTEASKLTPNLVDSAPKVEPDDEHYDIYDYVSKQSLGKPYEELTSAERLQLVEPVKEFAEKIYPKLITNIKTIRSADPKKNQEFLTTVLGTASDKIETDANGKVVQTFNNGNILDFETGEVIDNKEFRKRLESDLGKKSKREIIYTGYTPYSGLGTYYENHTNLNQLHTFKIGEKEYGFSKPVASEGSAERQLQDIAYHLRSVQLEPGNSRKVGQGAFASFVDYNNGVYTITNINPMLEKLTVKGDDITKVVNDYFLEVVNRLSPEQN